MVVASYRVIERGDQLDLIHELSFAHLLVVDDYFGGTVPDALPNFTLKLKRCYRLRDTGSVASREDLGIDLQLSTSRVQHATTPAARDTVVEGEVCAIGRPVEFT